MTVLNRVFSRKPITGVSCNYYPAANLHRDWIDGKWQKDISLALSALIPGDYEVPALHTDFYQGYQSWQLSTESKTITVSSSFGEEPRVVQDILPVFETAEPESGFRLKQVGFIPFFALFFTLAWRRNKRRKTNNAPEDALDVLCRNALENKQTDWEALRHWLQRKTGADPNGQLTTYEPLLHQYQSQRFGSKDNPEQFAELCRLCKERWE